MVADSRYVKSRPADREAALFEEYLIALNQPTGRPLAIMAK